MQEYQAKLTKSRTKYGINFAKILGLALLGVGAVALISSIIYAFSILALIGLGLIFWGAILTYIQTEEYTKKPLLDAIIAPSLATLNQIIKELDYKGKMVYLPPEYFKDPEANKIYMPKKADEKLPTPEQIQEQENKFFISDPAGILFASPGSELVKLFEKNLDTNFTKVDLKYLQRKLPRLFVEDLEICQNFEIETEKKTVRVKIENSIFTEPFARTEEPPKSPNTLSCALCSAIACALAKATGKPVTIEEVQFLPDKKTIEANFQLLETI